VIGIKPANVNMRAPQPTHNLNQTPIKKHSKSHSLLVVVMYRSFLATTTIEKPKHQTNYNL